MQLNTTYTRVPPRHVNFCVLPPREQTIGRGRTEGRAGHIRDYTRLIIASLPLLYDPRHAGERPPPLSGTLSHIRTQERGATAASTRGTSTRGPTRGP